MKLMGVLASLAIASTVFACGWDNDTLAEESNGIPNVQQALAGRFDVNPPEYYEFRIKLVQEKQDPLSLEDYDNLTVAFDKLGQQDESLKWMARKELALKTAKLPPNHDHWYRFYANRGTIYAHQWAKGGYQERALIEKGLRDLRRAVEINPDAHFGRENVQIEVLELLAGLSSGDQTGAMQRWHDYVALAKRENVRKGILGIMELGSGWDSPDMHLLLGSTMSARDKVLIHACILRAKELAARGKSGPVMSEEYFFRYGGRGDPSSELATLTRSGDEYRSYRRQYILNALKEGRHPDNDPKFWEGYAPPPMAKLKTPLLPYESAQSLRRAVNSPYPYLVIGLAIPLIVVALRVMRRARRMAK